MNILKKKNEALRSHFLHINLYPNKEYTDDDGFPAYNPDLIYLPK